MSYRRKRRSVGEPLKRYGAGPDGPDLRLPVYKNASRLMTVAEVADYLRLTPKGVYSLVEKRKIPFVKVSNRLRFIRSDVVLWLRGNRVSALELEEDR